MLKWEVVRKNIKQDIKENYKIETEKISIVSMVILHHLFLYLFVYCQIKLPLQI